MNKIFIAAVSLLAGCDKCDRFIVNSGKYVETTTTITCGKIEFASDKEYQSAGWYAPAVACKTENGVMVCYWEDSGFRYKSNTVTGVVATWRKTR